MGNVSKVLPAQFIGLSQLMFCSHWQWWICVKQIGEATKYYLQHTTSANNEGVMVCLRKTSVALFFLLQGWMHQRLSDIKRPFSQMHEECPSPQVRGNKRHSIKRSATPLIASHWDIFSWCLSWGLISSNCPNPKEWISACGTPALIIISISSQRSFLRGATYRQCRNESNSL